MSDPAKIRMLNDTFRRTGEGGKFIVSAGVNRLFGERIGVVLKQVRDYDDFGPEEPARDMGFFTIDGKSMFWKIDYYSPDLQWLSEDRSDPSKTVRVMTIALMEEY